MDDIFDTACNIHIYILSSNFSRNARMRALAAASVPALSVSSAPPTSTTHHHHMETPRVRIWLELGGPNGTGSVEVGVATTLTVRAIVPGNIGVRVVDCAALDAATSSDSSNI